MWIVLRVENLRGISHACKMLATNAEWKCQICRLICGNVHSVDNFENKETMHPITHFTGLCINEKTKNENTVLGYKKGSNLDVDVGFGSTTPTLYVVILVTFLKKVVSHCPK